MVVAGTPGSQSHLDNGLCRVARRVGFVAICREWMETSARQKASIDQSRGYCARAVLRTCVPQTLQQWIEKFCYNNV